MKILSLLFIATIMFFSFNAFTSEHTDPINKERSNCATDCFFTSCDIDCDAGTPGGSVAACGCPYGLAACACIEVNVQAAPNQPNGGQGNNLTQYLNLLASFDSPESNNVINIANQVRALIADGVQEEEIATYYNLADQHTEAVESLPASELMQVNRFFE